MICDGCTHEENCPAKAEHGGAKRCSAFKPMTEQEYLQTCNTEQLAEFLFEIGEYDWLKEIAVTSDKALRITDIAEWLKQPHTIKE